MTEQQESVWTQVEKIAGELEQLPASEASQRLRELAEKGTPASVLALARSWQELPAPVAPMEEGEKVPGNYTLIRLLGEGGMGSVWLAMQNAVGREVALKFVPPTIVSPALRERFETEVKILGRLRHPGIVPIFDAGFYERKGITIPFLAMEHVEGEPLSQWAARHRGDRKRLLELMVAICAALKHAHDRQIVHRDLKPGNILVRNDGQPVILDFGLARLAGGEFEEGMELFSGTPHYAAPEQFLGRDRDFRSGESVDIYAAGVVLFEMLTGRRLFEFAPGETIGRKRSAILEGKPPRLAEVLTDCPPLLDEIAARAVRRDPADRYYSIGALARALQRAIPELAGESPPEEPPWAPGPGAIIPGTDWALIEFLGSGATGQVWTGVHRQLQDRRVFKFCDSEEKVRSLKREMTLFRLLKERVGRNPHFIQIYDVALDDPPWYLVMEHAPARDLDAWCAAQPGGLAALSLETRLEIVAQTAEALQAAHEAGILHRDIKPANLLIGKQRDAEQKDGAPRLHVYITDFGIGQIVADDLLRGDTRGGFTATIFGYDRGKLTGTMLYLAPEVLEGAPATARSDIYSLGVILWQLLAGNLHAALDPANWSLRVEDPLLREDLARCLAGISENRWTSAGELAASLRSLPERRAIEERRRMEIEIRERAAYRRGVWRAAALASVVLLVVAGLGAFAWAKSRSERVAAKRAGLARGAAAAGEARALLATTTAGRTSRALTALREAAPEAQEMAPQMRNLAAQLLIENDYTLAWRREVPGMDAAVAPSVAGNIAAVGLRDGTVILLQLDREEAPISLPRPEGMREISMLALDASARRLAVADREGRCGWWEIDSRQFHNVPERVSVMSFDRAGRRLALGLRKDEEGIGGVVLRDCEAGAEPVRLVSRVFPQSREANSLAFSADAKQLAVSSDESLHVLVWDLQKGAMLSQLFHPAPVSSVAWLPGAQPEPRIAAAGRDGRVHVWRSKPESPDGFSNTPLARWQSHQWPVEQIAVAEDGVLASRDRSGEVVLRRASGDDILTRFPASADVRAVALARGGRVLWQTAAAIELHALPSNSPRVRVSLPPVGRMDIDFSPDGSLTAVATGSEVRIYGTQSGRLLGAVEVARAHATRFAADGSLLVMDRHGVLRWPWRREGSRQCFDPPARLPNVRSGMFEVSGDGSTLLVTAGLEVIVARMLDAVVLQPMKLESPAVNLALNEDGSEFAIAQENGRILASGTPYSGWSALKLAGQWIAFAGGSWRGETRPFAVRHDLEAAAVSDSVWILKAGGSEVLRSPEAGPSVVDRMRLSRNGALLGIMWRDGNLDIWSLGVLQAKLQQLGLAWSSPTSPPPAALEPPAIELAAPPESPTTQRTQ